MAWLLVAVAWVAGGVPFGLLVGKLHGVDVRDVGSGNIGATNVWRSCGPTAGIIVFVLDVLKGFGPALLARQLAPDQPWLHVACGGFAVLGHSYSPWLGFAGGKGVATSLGVLFAVAPVPGLVGWAAWGIVTAVTRYVSVGSLVATAVAGLTCQLQANPLAYKFVVWLAVALIWYRHRANIVRLLRGEEHRLGSKKPVPPEEPAPDPASEEPTT